MNVQDFSMPLAKSGGGKPSLFPELGKNRQEDGQFQSMLENMGLLAMFQTPVMPQTVPQQEPDGKTVDLAISMAENTPQGPVVPEYPEIPKGMETLYLGNRISAADIGTGKPAVEALQDTDTGREPDLVITAEFALPAPEEGQEPLAGQTRQAGQTEVKNEMAELSAPSEEPGTVPDGGVKPREVFHEAKAPQRLAAPAADKEKPLETIPSLGRDGDGPDGMIRPAAQEHVDRFQIRQPRKEAVPAGQGEADPIADAHGQINIQSFSDRSKAQEAVPHVTVRQEADFPDAIGKALNTAVRTGKDELEIRLEPGNLGRISIKISASENQTVITLSCSQEKTLQLLTQNAREIGAIMETNLGTAPQILVEKQAADYLEQESRQGGRQPKDERQQQQQKHRDDDPEDFLQRLRVGMMTVVPQ